MGILEIHGLQSEGVTNNRNYERPIGALQAMIAAEDFRCVDRQKHSVDSRCERLKWNLGSLFVCADSRRH